MWYIYCILRQLLSLRCLCNIYDMNICVVYIKIRILITYIYNEYIHYKRFLSHGLPNRMAHHNPSDFYWELQNSIFGQRSTTVFFTHHCLLFEESYLVQTIHWLCPESVFIFSYDNYYRQRLLSYTS
jgi:hypothetical protein